jgi:hypothetical protein
MHARTNNVSMSIYYEDCSSNLAAESLLSPFALKLATAWAFWQVGVHAGRLTDLVQCLLGNLGGLCDDLFHSLQCSLRLLLFWSGAWANLQMTVPACADAAI